MQTRSRTLEMPSGLSLPLAFGMKCRNDYEINSLPRHFWLTARTCGKGLFGELANLETT